MKRLSILVLVFAFMFAFSLGVMAQDKTNGDNGNGGLWTGNAGTDPATDEGWLIDVGTLEGWTASNFETLEYQASGKSEEVGTGITVEGIKVDWEYTGGEGFIGKGEDVQLNQSIDYTVVAFAEIPCVLKMNVFGNGGWAEGISIGNDSEVVVDNGLYMNDGEENGEVAPGTRSHFMIFDPDYGGIVDENWDFMELDAVDYATGLGAGAYINACDLWTADVWANVPYGFAVSSTGLGASAGLNPLLSIEMRYLERVEAGIVSNRSGLPPYNDNDNGFVVTANGDWAGDFELDEDGKEIGQYDAGQNVHINMQFRVPVTGAPAGRYQGEVTFSSYTI